MEKLLILNKILIIFLIFYTKVLFSQTYKVPENYIEAPLIFSHETVLRGISLIMPVKTEFSKYSRIELSRVKKNILEPTKWLQDKFHDELGNIAETERLLRSKDSPLADPIFDQFKHLPMYIEDTLNQLVINPSVFCNPIQKNYNKMGIVFDLECTIPFGFFNKYLILRLQIENMVWYFTKITSLNYNRLIELRNIAESFQIKK
ncbi:MAG: hypothetical protein CMP40_00585 [Rickettsiales bacterium]|nr:hypothetical protein [Rickettsiales bacterium]